MGQKSYKMNTLNELTVQCQGPRVSTPIDDK